MFKKLFSLVTLATIFATLIPAVAFADKPTSVLTNDLNGRTFVSDADTVIITATFTNTTGINQTYPPRIAIASDTTSLVGGDIDDPTDPTHIWMDCPGAPTDFGVCSYTWDVPTGDMDVTVRAFALDADPTATEYIFSDYSTGISSYTIDNTAPVVTVTALSTSDQTPPLSGTVDDATATVTVEVDGQTFDAYNLGNGEWVLGDNRLNTLAYDTYDVAVTATDTAGNIGTDVTTDELIVTEAQLAVGVTTFTVSPATGFDPAVDGENEDLTIDYTLSVDPDTSSVEITDKNGDSVRTISGSGATESLSWDGNDNGDIVEPGIYTVTLKADKEGYTSATETRTVTVEYNDSGKPEISDISITPTTFNPDNDEVKIEFQNEEDADITVTIIKEDGEVMRTFSDYNGESYSDNTDHSFYWNGENTSGSTVSDGSYKIHIVLRNSSGVTVHETTVTVDDDTNSTDYPSSNSDITGISFSPSSTFEPLDDEEMEIEFDVKRDLDSLEIYAIRGSDEDSKVDLYDEDDVDEENNIEITWEGLDDDDEYVREGTWNIIFESVAEDSTTTLYADKDIDIKYEEPRIDDFFVSKKKIDNDLGEITYLIFRTDEDAEVTIEIYEDNQVDDELVEEMEVEKDEWYAIEWDGDSYDYDDDIDFKMKACSPGNDEVCDSEKISMDLAEDDVSSSRSNITEDQIDPVIGSSSEERVITFDLEDEADVEITIYKGQKTSGSSVIELIDVDDMPAGGHIIKWDGRDDDEDKLSSGIYTYKITSKKSSTETEYGYFVVGNVGDIDGGGSSSSSSSSNSKISSNVVVDGVGSIGSSVGGLCSGFRDISAGSSNCAAITWTKEVGIFQGYNDGSFKPYQAISRAEALKVILEALNIHINIYSTEYSGFRDVPTSQWYSAYIKGAKDIGIFNGDGNTGLARPEATVNRAEILKLLFEGMKVSTGYYMNGWCPSSPYSDVVSGNWFYNYACEAKSYGLFKAVSGGYLRPESLSTRSEVAEVLYTMHLAGLL